MFFFSRKDIGQTKFKANGLWQTEIWADGVKGERNLGRTNTHSCEYPKKVCSVSEKPCSSNVTVLFTKHLCIHTSAYP